MKKIKSPGERIKKEEQVEETHIRVPVKFKEDIQEIIDYRANQGLKKRKSSRIVEGLMNLDLWETAKKRLKNATFKDKKGQATTDLIPFAIGIFAMLIIIGAFHYGFDLVTNILSSSTSGFLNSAVQSTFGQINTASALGVKLATTGLIFGLIFGLMFIAYFSKGKIWFLGIDFVIMIFAYSLAVILRNRYEEFLTSVPFSSQLQSYTFATSFMLSLPKNIIIIGGILIILSIIGNLLRSKEEELSDIFE